jgi:hypothetical protein
MGTFAETAIVKSITVDPLPTKENKRPFLCFRVQLTNGILPFPFSICGIQREIAVFNFSISSVFRLQDSGNMETWAWRHGHGDMETWRHGGMEMEHEDMVTSRRGHRDIKWKMEAR